MNQSIHKDILKVNKKQENNFALRRLLTKDKETKYKLL